MRSAAVAIAAFLGVAVAAPGLAAERSIQEIQDCARKNLPEQSARQDLSLLVRDGAGQEQTIEAEIPPEVGSKYQRVVTFVDQETCVPLKTELMEGPEQVRKEVVIAPEQVKAEGSRFVPREIFARDLEGSSETRMRVEKVEYDVPLSDSFFSEAALTKGH